MNSQNPGKKQFADIEIVQRSTCSEGAALLGKLHLCFSASHLVAAGGKKKIILFTSVHT